MYTSQLDSGSGIVKMGKGETILGMGRPSSKSNNLWYYINEIEHNLGIIMYTKIKKSENGSECLLFKAGFRSSEAPSNRHCGAPTAAPPHTPNISISLRRAAIC